MLHIRSRENDSAPCFSPNLWAGEWSSRFPSVGFMTESDPIHPLHAFFSAHFSNDIGDGQDAYVFNSSRASYN